MVICRELSKLSKPICIKSINFRNVVPGSPDAVLTPTLSLSSYLPRNTLVDPTHPAAFLPRYAHKTFPSFRSNIFGIRAYPKALLAKPEVEWPDPPFKKAKHLAWHEIVGDSVVGGLPNPDGGAGAHAMKLKTGSIDMAMLNVLGKKVHKKAVIRKRIISRLKTALSLVVVRGADAKDVKGRLKLDLDNGETKQWILPNWVYIFFPTLEVYRLPYPELVRTLRNALGTIYDRGLSMELSWCDVAKERSLSLEKRTGGVTKRYKQTPTSRPQRTRPKASPQPRLPEVAPQTPRTSSPSESDTAADTHEKPWLMTSEELAFGLRKSTPKPKRAEPYPWEIADPNTTTATKNVKIKMDSNVVENSRASPTWAKGHDVSANESLPTPGRVEDNVEGPPELPEPPRDTFSLFDDLPKKPQRLAAILSKSMTDKDTRGLNPERPRDTFDFGFDTVLSHRRDANASNELTSPPTASNSEQVSDLFLPLMPMAKSLSSRLEANLPKGSGRKPLSPPSLHNINKSPGSSRSAPHPGRSTRPHVTHSDADHMNVPAGSIDKPNPDAKPRRPGIALFQTKPIFMSPRHQKD